MVGYKITRTQRKREQTIAEYVAVPPAVLYDIGVGAKTEWKFLPEVWPKLQVIGVEPNPEQCRTLKINGFRGELHPVALGIEPGIRPLYLTPGHPNTSSFFRTATATHAIDVAVWTLEHLDAISGRPERILIWMDAEGAELEILQSGSDLLRSGRVRWLNLEVRDTTPAAGWPSAQQIHDHLTALDYLRVVEYGHCHSHRDVIYRHKSARQRKQR